MPELLNFSTEELIECLHLAAHEYQVSESRTPTDNNTKSLNELNTKNTGLHAVKYLTSHLVYGVSTLDPYDLQIIESIADFWITNLTTKRDFEFSKIKYKIPSAFYAQPVKLNALLHSFDSGISPMQLEAPEACHLLPSVESVIGDDIYMMTRFSKLVDTLPASSSNVKIYDRSLTPLESNLLL